MEKAKKLVKLHKMISPKNNANRTVCIGKRLHNYFHIAEQVKKLHAKSIKHFENWKTILSYHKFHL